MEVARPFIHETQKLPPGMPRWWCLDTKLGVRILHFLLATLTRLKVDKLLFHLVPEAKGGLELPYYSKIVTRETKHMQ